MARDNSTPMEQRERARDRFKSVLLQRGNPRGQMFLILGATGLVGFVSTAVLRSLGVESMGWRYLFSVGIAYLAFLGMLGLWMIAHRRRSTSNREWANGVDAYVLTDGLVVPPRIGPIAPQGLSNTQAKSDGWGVDLGSGDGEGALLLVVLLIILALVVAVFASAWIIVDAPILMAELLLDGALMAGVATRLRPTPGQHWAYTAVKRTWIPFALTAAVFAFVGFVMQHFVPNATTLIEAVKLAAG